MDDSIAMIVAMLFLGGETLEVVQAIGRDRAAVAQVGVFEK